MASPQVETVGTGAEKIKLALAAGLVAAAIVAFYVLTKQGQLVQWGALLACLVAAGAVFFTSETGKQLIGFGRDSAREVKKVAWPARKEAVQMTAYVFGFVLIMAIFLWATDKTLEWLIFDLILGWKK
jgi:preprotein translocase subunit SecE